VVSDWLLGDVSTTEGAWFTRALVVDYSIVTVVALVSTVVQLAVPAHLRYLPPGDTSVTYPLEKDIVSMVTLLCIAVIPILIFVVAFVAVYRSRHDLHHAVLGWATALALTFLFTAVIKTCVGRYRPDFLELSMSVEGSRLKEVDARGSFPSGHSSISFASMTFLSLYLVGKTHLFSDENGSVLFKAITSLSPMVLSGFVAVSRVVDYHHHFSDIIAGSLLGAGMGAFCYLLYFHSVFSLNSHRPRKPGRGSTNERGALPDVDAEPSV
jgi:diacylglycerol diphosphate phosphatase/phosphatidate phosphatase